MEWINKYFINVIKTQYVDFSGKADRPQFWYYFLIDFILFFALSIIAIIFAFISWHLGSIIWGIEGLLGLALLLPFLAIGARRLRDAGFSPLFLLLLAIPFVFWFVPLLGMVVSYAAFIALVVLWVMPSKGSAKVSKAKAK